MSWCGRCFTGQPESDFDSDDDGEYEYFVNSHYICKRKKTDVAPDSGNTESTAESTMSEVCYSTSQDQSSSLRCRSKGRPSCSKTDDTSQTSSCEADKKSSIDAAQLGGARIWQVGHATINGPNPPYDPFHKPFQTLCSPSTSGSDRTTEIVFKQSSQQDSPKTVLTPSLSRPGKVLVTTKISTPPSTANSKISYSSGQASKLKNRPGFIQRLFGRSGKSVFCRKSGGASQPSGFKESMEQPSPAVATNTLYWTVRVKMK